MKKIKPGGNRCKNPIFHISRFPDRGDIIVPIIQVALDLLELDRAVEIAKEAVAGGADWIEIGTPLIKSEGMDSIRTMRKAFPDRTILADMKTVDTGAMEVEMAAKAGADVAIILGSADDSTILDALRSAHKYGVRVMADLISAPEPIKRAVDLEALGVDYINVHVGIDQQMVGKDPISILMEISEKVSVQLAVAGGLDAEGAAKAVKAGARIVIVGGNITRSDNVTEAAKKIRQSVDSPESVDIRAKTSAFPMPGPKPGKSCDRPKSMHIKLHKTLLK